MPRASPRTELEQGLTRTWVLGWIQKQVVVLESNQRQVVALESNQKRAAALVSIQRQVVVPGSNQKRAAARVLSRKWAQRLALSRRLVPEPVQELTRKVPEPRPRMTGQGLALA